MKCSDCGGETIRMFKLPILKPMSTVVTPKDSKYIPMDDIEHKVVCDNCYSHYFPVHRLSAMDKTYKCREHGCLTCEYNRRYLLNQGGDNGSKITTEASR